MPSEPQRSLDATLQALFDELANLSTADIDYHLITPAQDTISDAQHAEEDKTALSLHQGFHLPDEFERSQYLLELVPAVSDGLASCFKNRGFTRADKLFPYSRTEGAKEHTPIYILAEICSILLQQPEPSFSSLRRLRCLRKDAPISVPALRAVSESNDLLQQQLQAAREAWKEGLHGEHNLGRLQRMRPIWDRQGALYDWADIDPMVERELAPNYRV
ncbi:hypothetical protein PsYK624_102940 [Phanerochaete sordida]|uniref:Uncharacterized protein n=1 Tax=Phanerochaete sordida TaxID=48140 RepID=A0A9P3GG17_9APHY|nr:hypothetical protein PsYK624_102940 [Phanerochaete sordida]